METVLGRFVVHGLIPGESYVFRVQAVNLFGLSDESQESSPISVEPALGKTDAGSKGAFKRDSKFCRKFPIKMETDFFFKD